MRSSRKNIRPVDLGSSLNSVSYSLYSLELVMSRIWISVFFLRIGGLGKVRSNSPSCFKIG